MKNQLQFMCITFYNYFFSFIFLIKKYLIRRMQHFGRNPDILGFVRQI